MENNFEQELFVMIDASDYNENMKFTPESLNIFLITEQEFAIKKVMFKAGDIVVIRFAEKSNINSVMVKIQEANSVKGYLKLVFYPVCYCKIEKEIDYNSYKKVRIRKIQINENLQNADVHLELLREKMERLIKYQKNMINPDFLFSLNTENDVLRLSDKALSILNLEYENMISIMIEDNLKKRVKTILEELDRKIINYQTKEKINNEVQKKIAENQKQYFLNEQLKIIKKEMGLAGNLVDEHKDFIIKIKKSKMPAFVEKKALMELDKIQTMSGMSPEATVIRNYLDWILNIPWYKTTEDNIDMKLAEKILNRNHFGLEKIKERVLEYLAVIKLAKKIKSQILCFVGPPGVGKTSLGHSIAESMGRKFIRISLGGVRDEAEIRGHRKTYIGSLPGKIIQMMRRANVVNPVFMLDEIDKLGRDYRGDPASALLEVLDPQLNNSFIDHYLEVEYDLSNVLFICTANVVHTIPPALLDRMEIINLPGYLEFEKFNICRKYLINKAVSNTGLKKNDVEIKDEAIKEIIKKYTMESGVRNLEKQVSKIMRKIAKRKAGGVKNRKIIVDRKHVIDYLGPPLMNTSIKGGKSIVGVANGLAWTQYGGDVMAVETLIFPGSGKIELTGKLGDVLKESAKASISFLRKYSSKYGIEKDFYKNYDIHVHMPEGAIPKDGPSAGITIVVSLYSALKNKPIKRNFAMTGEITLRGDILPIGGIAEKIVAAQSAGIENVIIPFSNKPNFMDLPSQVRKNTNIYFIKTIDDALKLMFN